MPYPSLDPYRANGSVFFVSPTGNNSNTGKAWGSAKLTITNALSAAAAGDTIYVAPGDYDETVTITKDNISIIGVGARTGVSIAPSTANANAVFIDGTTASGRVEEVYLENINGDANGTGIGLYVKGNIRRIHTKDCKWEAGDTTGTGVKFEGTASDSPADCLIEGGEICWAQTGLSIDVGGGGSACTEIYAHGVKFHNVTANHVINATVGTQPIVLKDCEFHPLEAGTAPTGLYVDLRAGTTVGGVYNCFFPVASNGGKVLVDTDVKVLSRFTDGFNTAAPT